VPQIRSGPMPEPSKAHPQLSHACTQKFGSALLENNHFFTGFCDMATIKAYDTLGEGLVMTGRLLLGSREVPEIELIDEVDIGGGRTILYFAVYDEELFDNVTAIARLDGNDPVVEEISYYNGTDPIFEMSDLEIYFSIYGTAVEDFLVGSDRISGNRFDDVLRGYGGDDFIFGNAGADKLYGGGDDDHLYGGKGADIIRGGSGDDILTGNSGKDRLFGQSGHDTLVGGGGNDFLKGGSGDDRLLGKGGSDKIVAGSGSDHVFGGGGDDFIYGGKGRDILTGGRGEDTFVFSVRQGYNSISDFDTGRDVISITRGANSISGLNFSQEGEDVLLTFRGTSVLVVDVDILELQSNENFDFA
jgi:Ca2+-binding RTX toxin-like protein